MPIAHSHTASTSKNPIIDLDANPLVPPMWRVVEHRKGGQFEWDASKIELYRSKKQQSGKIIEGTELHEELKRQGLKGRSVLNANALDYLLKNRHLIPEEWKGKNVFFWGTVYRRSDGKLYVRCLFWFGHRWDWFDRWLGNEFDDNFPAALRVR